MAVGFISWLLGKQLQRTGVRWAHLLTARLLQEALQDVVQPACRQYCPLILKTPNISPLLRSSSKIVSKRVDAPSHAQTKKSSKKSSSDPGSAACRRLRNESAN